jgi:transmembrane sensor
MQRKNIKSVLEKINSGKLTPEEETMAEYWLHQLNLKNQSGYSDEGLERVSAEMWSVLEKEEQYRPRKVFKLWPRIVAAASVAAVLLLGVYFFNYDKPVGDTQSVVQDIAPGKNGATLTLADGQKILIKDAMAGKIATQSGVSISKSADGQIVYTVENNDHQNNNAINTLQTSNGEQTQVRLPDGTVVYLNSASSLKYPASFAKQAKRIVELTGEGYFHVSKDKQHPFIVKTGHQDVEVLGTQFNINSYAGEPVTRTTLLEGSVKVTGENKIAKILKPDQQAINSEKGIDVIDIEAQFFVDWKEGFFMFNDENLESIMKRVSRWYNVKVVYQDPKLKTEMISGTVSKYDKISSLVKVLERSGLATFKIEKDVVTISRKK